MTRHFLQAPWDGRGSLRERFDQVRPYLEGKSVLDIGCASRYRRDDWMHGLICTVAKEAVGLDSDSVAVEEIRRRGCDIRAGDAQNFALSKTFDVVFAGEIIEHLDDLHGFLKSVAGHLNEGGQLVLTTPNPFYLMNFVYRIGGRPLVNRQHTCWFCEDTIVQLLTRNGYETAEVRFIGHEIPGRIRRVIGRIVLPILPPRLRYDTLVAVARPSPTPVDNQRH